MLLAVYFLLLVMCIIRPHSKKLFYIMLVFLWFVAAFCVEHADYNVYYTRYNNFLSVTDLTEVGFNLLMAAFNVLGIQFQTFMCIAYGFVLITVAWFIKKYSQNFTLVLAMYAIFPYCIDAVQLRNTIAFCIVLFGLNLLLDDKERRFINNGWKKQIVYVLCVLIACTFHFSSILFLILLLPYNFKLMTTLVSTVIAVVVIAFVANATVITKVASIFVSTEKVELVLERINKYEFHNIVSIMLGMIIPTIIILFFLYIEYKDLLGLFKYEKQEDLLAKKSFIATAAKFQIASMIILPLISFNMDIYRVHRYIMLTGYIAMGMYGTIPKCKFRANRLIYRLLLVVAVIFIFYIQIYRLGNFDNTFWALFNNNKFF